jgi:hypothetical protein
MKAVLSQCSVASMVEQRGLELHRQIPLTAFSTGRGHVQGQALDSCRHGELGFHGIEDCHMLPQVGGKAGITADDRLRRGETLECTSLARGLFRIKRTNNFPSPSLGSFRW